MLTGAFSYLPGLVCVGMAVAAVALSAIVLISRSQRTPPCHYGELNLRIWAASANLELARVRPMGETNGQSTFRFVAEDDAGRRRSGRVTTDDRAMDSGSQRVLVMWEGSVGAMRAVSSVRDDPLWDDGLDGLPRA